MKKIAAMVLAGVLAAVPVSTTGAAEFQDGADTQNFIWAAGEETSTDTDESKGVSAMTVSLKDLTNLWFSIPTLTINLM